MSTGSSLTLVVLIWVASAAVYFYLIKWVQGRFNITISGSQNWGAVHLFIMLFFAPFAAAFMGLIYGAVYLKDKNGTQGANDDLDI